MSDNLESEVIERAVNGEHEAQIQVLKYYEWYINKVSLVQYVNRKNIIQTDSIIRELFRKKMRIYEL